MLAGAAFLLVVQSVWADEMSKAKVMITPVADATPAASHKAVTKVKKSKKKVTKEAAKEVWVCPMGDYSGPKTADGKCPKCGMDLEKKSRAKPAPKSEAVKKTYICEMDGFTSDQPGKCPKCGMDLVEKK